MRTTLKRIEKKRLPDEIIQQITAMIENGRFKIGDKLPSETVLMSQLGVGRSSIREAVRALSLTGILSVRQGLGTYVTAFPNGRFVSPLKWTDIKSYDRAKELVDARMALDTAILTSAMEKADKKDMEDLKAALRRLDSTINNRKKYNEAERSFHATLARASHNSILMHFYDELRPLIHIWIDLSSQIEANLRDSYGEHVEMVNAIEQKDLEKARQAVRKHLEEIGHFPV